MAFVEPGRRLEYNYTILAAVTATEAVLVNAIVHRGYSIAGRSIELAIYADRLEFKSPGHLPSSVTPEKCRQASGMHATGRLSIVMWGYRYVENRGMGVLKKIIPRMDKHNGTEPDFIE